MAALLAGESVAEDALQFLQRYRDQAPLVYSSADPGIVQALQERHGTQRVAASIERFFGKLAVGAAAAGFGRIVAAGGETSGAVVEALRPEAIDIGPQIAPGVPAMSARLTQGEPIALALKSGNFGGSDFFARAVRVLEERQ